MKSLLNACLKEARMTKTELAMRTGIGRTSLWLYSRDDGMGRARLGALETIAQAIGCAVKDLFEE